MSIAKQTASTTITKAITVAVVDDAVPAEFVLGKNKAQLLS